MSQKITFEEFQKRLKEATTTIIPISEFKGWNEPITYRCLVCNHEWDVKNARSITKYGCPNCGKQKRLEALSNAHKVNLKSEEQFRKELAEKQPNLIPNDKYVNSGTKYHCICKIHNCDVYTTPEKYLHRNQGCKLCAVERNRCATRYTHDSFVKKLSSVNLNLEVLSKYTNIKSRIDIRCKICNYEWSPIAESLVSKNPCGCPNCAGNAHKTTEMFKKELDITHPKLVLLTEYKSADEKVNVQCKECGKTFWVIPNKLQQGQHCPFCKVSHGEDAIRSVLIKYGTEFEMYKNFDGLMGLGGRKLSYDFFLPNQNRLIEYQGEQHEKPIVFKGLTEEMAKERFKIQQEHDRRKREYAKEYNIDLLEIWYWDFKNIESIIIDNLHLQKSKSA